MAKQQYEKANEGEFLYDDKYDILMMKVKEREYKISVEFQDFVVDLDTEERIMGVRIFDASKVLGVNKYTLQHIVKLDFKTNVQQGMITVRLAFEGMVKDKEPALEHFTQQLITNVNGYNFQNASVVCAAV